MELLETERKSRVLRKLSFGCLSGSYALNLTKGCEFRCVYCYARGYPDAPLKDKVYLYRNLPAKIAAELDNPRRRSVVESLVFNTASDCFQTHPRVLELTYATMEVLLKRGVGFSFLTKGWIPERFIRLFTDHPGLVRPSIGIVSTKRRYRDVFEPYAALPSARLHNIERLTAAGIETAVRIDPIIPFYTDDESTIVRLFRELALRGVKTVSLSYLHLRPAVMNQLSSELSSNGFEILNTCFRSRTWEKVGSSTRSKLLPRILREKGYERFRRIAKEFKITTLVCSCKNPDMEGHICHTGIRQKKRGDYPETGAQQLTLFPCQDGR